MNIYNYIATNNSEGANELLGNYGFTPTSNLNTLIERLKIIVRKYKKIALKDLTLIHPDKNLLEMFTTSTFDDKDFAYATGRTPGFVEPVVEEPSSFPKETPEPFDNTQQIQDTLNTAKVVEEIKAVKKQMVKEKLNSERRERNNRLLKMSSSSNNQQQYLMLAVGLIVGYIIGKK